MKLEIYDTDIKNRYRYSLGTRGKKTLYVIGLNPSTATNLKLDPTLRSVKSFSEILGFDGFVMLNLYPQRSTFPQNLHQRPQRRHIDKNREIISEFVASEKSPTLWAAWGDPINVRPYLFDRLGEIYQDVQDFSRGRARWIQYDVPTVQGHPRHPSRKKLEDRFQNFKIEDYLAVFGSL